MTSDLYVPTIIVMTVVSSRVYIAFVSGALRLLINQTTAQRVSRLLSLAKSLGLYHWTDFSNRIESSSDGLNNVPL